MDRLTTLLAYHREDPDDSFVRFAIASEYAKLGRVRDARKAFEDLTESDPTYVGTYYHLGKLYERLEETEKAIKTYARGIEVADEVSDPHAKSELQSALLESQGYGFE
ncbi:MAG: tetratricopeptide repeat protein [Bacteroidetes bacterium]|nr:tetratricopeptide repeat protein [Bacteroidota bacterium]